MSHSLFAFGRKHVHTEALSCNAEGTSLFAGVMVSALVPQAQAAVRGSCAVVGGLQGKAGSPRGRVLGQERAAALGKSR